MKLRLDFEALEETPSDAFAIKLYAIRKGGYYLPMTTTPTWENVDSFVSRALKASLDNDYKGHGDIKLVGAPRKSSRVPRSPPKAEEKTEEVKVVLTDAEIEERRVQKEKRRREEMERQAKEALFEEVEGEALEDEEYEGDEEVESDGEFVEL